MYKGGIQALELLKADKKTIKALEKNLKEEEAFGDWLEKNNPKIAKRLMSNQRQGKKKEEKNERKKRKMNKKPYQRRLHKDINLDKRVKFLYVNPVKLSVS